MTNLAALLGLLWPIVVASRSDNHTDSCLGRALAPVVRGDQPIFAVEVRPSGLISSSTAHCNCTPWWDLHYLRIVNGAIAYSTRGMHALSTLVQFALGQNQDSKTCAPREGS